MRVLALADEPEEHLIADPAVIRSIAPDVIVSCGDLPAAYLEHVVTLANVPLLYVPGNHDADYRRHAPEGCIDIDGRVVEVCGARFMGLGGSMRYNDRIVGYTEPEMYWRCIRLTLRARATGGADVLVTHAPLMGYGDLDDLPHRGFEAFGTAIDMLHPALMVHGHVHLNYGRIEREREHPTGTRIVNAFRHVVEEVTPRVRPRAAQGVSTA